MVFDVNAMLIQEEKKTQNLSKLGENFKPKWAHNLALGLSMRNKISKSTQRLQKSRYQSFSC